MAGGGSNKKRFQYCSDLSGQEILYVRALQGHSGRNLIDRSLQHTVLIPNDFFEYTYHIGCAFSLHSIVNSGLKPGGQNLSKRQTVFFTSVDPTNKEHRDSNKIDLEAPRLAWYHQKKWKKHQTLVYWVDINLLSEELKFYQTRSNAIIFHDTLPAYCISKVVVMATGEVIYEKVYVSPRPPPTISFKDYWMKELDSEVAGSSKDTQRIQPEPKTQSSRTVRPVGGQASTKEIEKGILFDHEDVKHSTRTGRPVVGLESTHSCVSMPLKIEEDQTRTVKTRNIDFRVPGLSHAVVKEAEYLRVQELVKEIESHPHREALQADLQQNDVCNPFSNNSKAMICELGNVELFELCETIPKVQCSHCLLYWNEGIVYCTCGQFLVDSESRRKVHKLRLDAVSIPNYVMKKGRSHGARHAKTKEQKEYHVALNAWKRRCKKIDFQGGHFTGIHDRFLRDQVFRESQLAIGLTEQKCKEMDELAKEDHTYHLTEQRRYQGQRYLTLNKSGKNGSLKFRSDFRVGVSIKNRLHRESGEKVEELISPE